MSDTTGEDDPEGEFLRNHGSASMPDDDVTDPSDVERPKSIDGGQYVHLDVRVDVSEMNDHQQELVRAMCEIKAEAFREFVEKNRAYNSSFLVNGAKLTMSPSYPETNPAREQVRGLVERAGDKRERFLTMFFEGELAGDGVDGTALENGNYWDMLALVTRYPSLCASVLDR
jgi:hypothetical protein